MDRVLFCADLHGNLCQFDAVISHALAEGIGLVVFGGDLTPKDATRRTPALQRAFLADELFPLFRSKVDPGVLQVLLILGNDDFRSNREFVVEQQQAGVPFRLIDRATFVTEDGFVIVGYSSVPSTPFRFKCWERRDLRGDSDFSARPDTRIEGVVSRGDELVLYSLDEALGLPSIEEDLDALTEGLHMDRLVLVTHAPPFDTVCDFNREHRHVGSRGVRAFIEARQPYLTLHGHIHETVDLSGEFVETIGRTRCVAVGNDHRPERPWVVEVGLGEDGPVVGRERI
jgi:Icc-related predicted phosphoesterase